MEELDEDLGALLVDGIDHPGEGLDAAIVGSHQEIVGIARRFMHPDDLHDDEPGAAFRARQVIGGQRLRRQVVLR